MPKTTYRTETWQPNSSFKVPQNMESKTDVTRNNVIMTSLQKTMENADLRETKQIIYHSKGTDESYPKNVLFIAFELLCQNVWAFMSNFGIFYDAPSPNMAMSQCQILAFFYDACSLPKYGHVT